LDLAVLAAPRPFGFAKTTISFAQNNIGFASLAIGIVFWRY